MDQPFLIEVCADTFDSALKAEQNGASRIELCTSLLEGGTTPPLSLIQKVCSTLKIPVHVMVRPRAGDFLYDDEEFEMMKADIQHCFESGAAGVVFGILKENGETDIDRCRMLVELASPMHITFHRAFDMTQDAFLAMEEIISLNINSILTSGQHQTAEDGLEMIRELVKRAGNRISIMAGGGINDKNIKLLAEAGVKEFHFTSRKKSESRMHFRNPVLQSMGSKVTIDEYEVFKFDEIKIQHIVSALKSAEIK